MLWALAVIGAVIAPLHHPLKLAELLVIAGAMTVTYLHVQAARMLREAETRHDIELTHRFSELAKDAAFRNAKREAEEISSTVIEIEGHPVTVMRRGADTPDADENLQVERQRIIDDIEIAVRNRQGAS